MSSEEVKYSSDSYAKEPLSTNKDKDFVLITWIIVAFLWDIIVYGTVTYLVFWKNNSGFWFFLAVILTSASTLFKALRRRYSIPDKDND